MILLLVYQKIEDDNYKETATEDDGNTKETAAEDNGNTKETADEHNGNFKEKTAVVSNDKEGTDKEGPDEKIVDPAVECAEMHFLVTPSFIKIDDPFADCTRLSDNETVKPGLPVLIPPLLNQ